MPLCPPCKPCKQAPARLARCGLAALLPVRLYHTEGMESARSEGTIGFSVVENIKGGPAKHGGRGAGGVCEALSQGRLRWQAALLSGCRYRLIRTEFVRSELTGELSVVENVGEDSGPA